MTPDPITAALQQLADHHEQLTQLTDLITGIGDTLREHEAALAKLAESPPADADPDRYRPSPSPAWWKLAAADRARTHRPAARLGRAGLPARLRPPGRHPGPLLDLPRPVPVRPGHPVRPVVGALPPARAHPRGCCLPKPNTRPASCPPWPPSW